MSGPHVRVWRMGGQWSLALRATVYRRAGASMVARIAVDVGPFELTLDWWRTYPVTPRPRSD